MPKGPARPVAGAALRLPALGIGLLLVAACGDQVTDRRPVPSAGAALGPPEFVGVWAARPALCGAAEWRIAPTALMADSGPACVFGDRRPSATGWSVTATCADGERRILELNPAPTDPETLVISDGPWGPPVTLVRCARPGAEQPVRDPHGLLDLAARTDLALAQGGPAVSLRRDPANAVVRAVWRRDGEIVKVVEPIVGSERPKGTRDYYFRPGERQPFLIRDAQGAFGYHRGVLVTSFSAEGEILSETGAREQRAAYLVRHAGTVRGMATTLQASPRQAVDGPKASEDG